MFIKMVMLIPIYLYQLGDNCSYSKFHLWRYIISFAVTCEQSSKTQFATIDYYNTLDILIYYTQTKSLSNKDFSSYSSGVENSVTRNQLIWIYTVF